jgi:hypothetical protein
MVMVMLLMSGISFFSFSERMDISHRLCWRCFLKRRGHECLLV